MKIDIAPKDLKIIKDLLNQYLPNTLVWAFGSRVKFTAKPTSDLDLVAFIPKEQELKLSLLKEALEESSLPFRIDLHNWHELPETFHKKIENSFVVVQDDVKEELPIGWKTYKLGEIASKIGSGATPRGGKEVYLDTGEISLIRSQNVLDFSFSKNGLAFISEEQAHELRNVTVEKNDILLNITGDSVARVCQVPDELIPARVNQHVAIIRVDEHKLDAQFLKYQLLTPSFKGHLLGLASAGATRNALTKSMIENLDIQAPDLPTQRQIASILSSLDDKIELNLQMNQTLEAMAQAIFKEWFVNYNFPGFDGELVDGLPKGWRVEKLANICLIKYGKDHKHLNDGNIPVYGSGGIMRFVEKALYEKESILIPRKGTLSNLFYVTEPFWSVDTMFYTIIKEDAIRKYLFYLLKTLNLASMNVGSAVPSLTTEVLNKIDIVVPEHELLQKFEDAVSTFFSKIKVNNQQNQSLTQTRDTLLPRLMSGQLEVV